MAELIPLCDFPAGIVKVQTMADGSPRIVLECEESVNEHLSLLAKCHADKRYLHIVIYDEREFKGAIINQR